MRIKSLKRFLIISLLIVFISASTSFTISCTPELSFGELVVCGDINQETYEPLDHKDKFDIGTEKIYATIDYYGVKGDDNYRYSWLNMDTGENILEKTLKYSEGESGYFEGYAMSYMGTNNEVKVIPPGNYKIEFYHNGELKETANFMVEKPEVEILEVSLTNEVDKNYTPVNETQQFISTEIIYACVKVNYYISGNNLKAKWYDSNGNLVIETLHPLDVDLFEPSWIAFTLTVEGREIPADSYKVEIYLNDSLYNTYNFEVSNAHQAESGGEFFTSGNIYSNEKYGVSFAVPDNWVFTESEDDFGLSVNLAEQSGNLPVGILFTASFSDDYPPAEEYRGFADEVISPLANDNNLELMETREQESITKKGVKYNEFVYLFKDAGGTEWAAVIAFSENNGIFNMLFVTAIDDYYFQTAESIYFGVLESLEFN